MDDTKSLAFIVLIILLYLLYLHMNGRLIPLVRYATNTPGPKTGQTLKMTNPNNSLLNILGNAAILGVGAETGTGVIGAGLASGE